MFKNIIAVAVLAIAASAQAAPAVVNSTGNVVYGTAQVLSIEKDSSAGFNRVKVKYASGYQFVNDDASWSRYAKIAANLKAPVAASATMTYDIAQSNGITCQAGASVIAWPNVGMADSLNDGCAFFNAAKAASNE